MPRTEPPRHGRFDPTLLAQQVGAYAFYRWEGVAINVWAAAPSGEAVRVLARLTEDSLTECPDGIASVHWICSGAGVPTAEARAGLSDIAKRYERHLVCVGVVLAGSGFWASALRSALSGIVLLAARSYALRFCADLASLSAFIAEELKKRKGTAPPTPRIAGTIEAALAGCGVSANS